MNDIRDIIGKLYRNEMTEDEAVATMATIPLKTLAEFIVDAHQRGWISNGNLGLDEDGNPM